MSDEFDKEAEREKLRERFEREEEDRQATEHMSQLLLQGATMTNHHCDDCGDPIFRHDGQEFCPTCEKPVESPDQGADAAGQEAEQAQTNSQTVDDTGQPADPQTGDPEQMTGGDVTTTQPTQPSQQPSQPSTPSQPSGTAQGIQSTPTGATTQEGPQSQSQSQSQPSTAPTAGSGTLGDARLALVRRITALAREAEASEDIQRTRQLFEAVHEGADALAALNRNADR